MLPLGRLEKEAMKLFLRVDILNVPFWVGLKINYNFLKGLFINLIDSLEYLIPELG